MNTFVAKHTPRQVSSRSNTPYTTPPVEYFNDNRTVAIMQRKLQMLADAYCESQVIPRSEQSNGLREVVQRQLTISGAVVTTDKIKRRSAYKTRLNRILVEETGGTGFQPSAIRDRLIAWTTAGNHPFATRRAAVRAALADVAWVALQHRNDVVYSNPAMDEGAALGILHALEEGQTGALDGLNRQGAPYTPTPVQTAREHEWGILKSRTRNECVLIIGERTGVSWEPFLKAGRGIAHSHPYFEAGRARNRHGNVSTATKEIADYPLLPAGIIAWADLETRAGGDAAREVSKIFPSASDIEFSAKQNLAEHTVLTPYAIVRQQGQRYIANPEVGNGHFRNAPRLVFVIRNAHKANDGMNYTCDLQAREVGNIFWTRTVTTNGLGQLGLLNW